MRRLRGKFMGALVMIGFSCVAVRAQAIESLMNAGQELLRNGAYPQAVTQFRKVLEREPNNFEAQHNLGFAYLGMGRNADAVNELKKAIKLNGKNAETWANLAVAYENQGQSKQALEAFYTAVNLNPSNIDARMNLATLYVNDDQTAKAVAQYKQIISADKMRVGAYVNLAKCLVKTGDTRQAREYLKEAVTIDPQNAEAHWELGNILWKKENDTEKALREYQIAVNLEKTSQVYYNELGLLLQELGRKDEAVEVWKTYLIYLDDALMKERVRKRIDQLQTGMVTKEDGTSGGVSSMSPDDADKQHEALKKDLRSGDAPRETKMLETSPVDIMSDLEDLQADESEKVDLKEEAKKRSKQ